MKSILITTLSIAPLALADISLGSGTPSLPPAPSQDAQAYISAAKEVLGVVIELSSVLEGVKDQASADAAAPKVGELTKRMIELQKKSETMPAPGAEIEQQVRASMNMAEVQQVVTRFLNSYIQIGMNQAYGSQALLNAISPVLNSMPGQVE